MPVTYLNGSLLAERKTMWATRLTPESAAGTGSYLVVVVEDAILHGVAYRSCSLTAGSCRTTLHVLPARKRSGIGRQLMRHAFTWAATHHPGKAVYLEVLRDNAPAVAFYERNGGRLTREFMERFPAGFELPVVEYAWAPDAIRVEPGGG
ncbi:GNAT family N-acetyltransferase [Nonomuraea sp. NPDC050536]|uniref:GNAT family N-acetyltransferase n=1 Tax=Nonomuraea sp. NPDC050536 TaxID=3364366 RepID=UPI0037CA80B9